MKRDRRVRWMARLDGESLPALDEPVQPAINARPGRAPLPPAGTRTADAAAHHWIFTGPRNVGGRVRALAIHPGQDQAHILYAGTASGGVFKSEDRGESWRAVWHDQHSLSIAAIAIAPSDPTHVYVATGEPPGIPGAGIYRSTNDGAAWEQIARVDQLHASVRFEQIVVHPLHKNIVYAVGPRGVFRSTNADAATRTDVVFRRLSEGAGENLEDPVAYSDAAFGTAQGDPNRWFLYLCRARTVGGEIVRLDQPDAAQHADVEAALQAAGNRKAVLPADPNPIPLDTPQWIEPHTERGRISLCRDQANVMFAVFARNAQDHTNAGYRTPLRAMMRCQNANRTGAGGFSGSSWTEVRYRTAAQPNNWASEDFGWWMLTISVHPTDPNLVFFGMVNLYVCRDANSGSPDWHPAMPGEIWRLDKVYHPDNHAVVFDRHGEAWLANDGGVSVTANLATWRADATRSQYPSDDGVPEQLTRALIPPRPLRWRRRVDGLVAVQAYDVTQSPLVPTMMGCGLQDMGVWFTAGGDTWRWALDGDGGFTAFDPDDPYRSIMTWQDAVHTSYFAGQNERLVPARDVFLAEFAWPRALRDGFLRSDSARFTGDTIHHPRRINRVVTLRESRAYATHNGEHFQPLRAGAYLDLQATFRHLQSPFPDPVGSQLRHDGMVLLEIRDTAGARKLGFLAGTKLMTRNRTPNPFRVSAAPNPTAPRQTHATNLVMVRNLAPELYALAENDTLELVLRCRDRGGSERDFNAEVRFVPSDLIRDLGHATAAEVAEFIRARVRVAGPIPLAGEFSLEITAWPAFGATPAAVEIITTARTQGASVARIAIDGTQGVPQLFGRAVGTYAGAEGRPASVSLALSKQPKHPREAVSVPDGAELRLTIGGTAIAPVRFTRPQFSDLGAVRSGELVAALNASFGGVAVAVASLVRKSFVIRRVDAGQRATVVTAGSTALAELTSGNAPPGRATALDRPGPEPELTFRPGTRWNGFDLHEDPPGTPRRLIVRGAAPPGNVTIELRDADFVDPRNATVEEVVARIQARLAAVPASNLRCDLLVSPSFGEPTEAAYDPHTPDALWIGGMDGTIWRSPDDGRTWRRIPEPRFARQGRAIEAITVHPASSEIVFVGLAAAEDDASGSIGREDNTVGEQGDRGTLYLTEDAGVHWRTIGADAFTVSENPDDPAARRRPVGVIEVVIDPASTALASTRLWVATYIGVFESRDGGQTFAPLDEGLPSARVSDLAYEPTHQLLRCSTFGRGTYARYVGARPANPAPLYLRMSLLDDGTARPADDGYDGFAGAPQQARRWESPDIKVSALPWTSSSATLPELGPGPEAIDGVELDEQVEHQPFGAGAGPVNVFVQVHSRSAVPISDARVILLWADGRSGPPPLGLEFWTAANLAAATPVVPPGSAWTVIAATAVTPAVTADRPTVVRVAFDPPAAVGGVDELGLLAVVTSAAHPTAPPDRTDVARLLEREPRVAYRATRTRVTREAQSILLAHERGGVFTVAEVPAATGAVGLGLTGNLVRAARSNPRATFDVRGTGATPRRLAITVDLTTTNIDLPAADFVSAAAATPAEIRRVLERELRLARLPVRTRVGEVVLSVRGPDRAAALAAVSSVEQFPERLMVLNRWQRAGALSRGTAQHVHLRVANDGDAPETAIAWRVYAIDPDADPFVLTSARVVGSGTIAALAPGASEVVEVSASFTPTAPPAATRHLLVAVTHAAGDPLRDPFRADVAEPVVFAEGPADAYRLAQLDAYCEANPSVAYRLFELVA